MRIALVALALLCLGASCGGQPEMYAEPYIKFYDRVSPPDCAPHERRRLKKRSPYDRVHVCWTWGDRTDRIVTPSCRVTVDGTAVCTRRLLASVPKGRYVDLDDDGFDACALREDGSIVCWGLSKRGWSRVPRDEYVDVSMGRGPSPYHTSRSYACGLTRTKLIRCWEDGSDGDLFELPGLFVQMEAGWTVCGVDVTEVRHCLPTTHSFPLPPPDVPGRLAAVTLGRGPGCVLNSDHTATCWGVDRTGKLTSVGDVKLVRGGDHHVCGLHETGEVFCVGDAPPPPKMRFVSLSRPGFMNNYCGIALSGIGYCWGDPFPPE